MKVFLDVVFLASLLMVVLVTHPPACHGLPAPKADPYRYQTGKDNRQSLTGWQKVQLAAKLYRSQLRYPNPNDKRRPSYPKSYDAASPKQQPNYPMEEDAYVIVLEQVPKQTPYNPIPYAVYFAMTADGVETYDSGISY